MVGVVGAVGAVDAVGAADAGAAVDVGVVHEAEGVGSGRLGSRDPIPCFTDSSTGARSR